MKINCIKKTPKIKPTWEKWFAWYPVRINDKQLAWLEIVERNEIVKTYATQDDWTRYHYRSVSSWLG